MMTVTAMFVYYGAAFVVLALVARHAVWQNVRDADASFAQLHAALKVREHSPVMPAPLPMERDDFDLSSPDLSAAALRPITPLLMRLAREYLEKPNDRERLVLSITDALDATTDH